MAIHRGLTLMAILAVGFSESRAAAACEAGHWIDTVSEDGTIVKLEDGSVWEVDESDAIDTVLWLPTTEIVACDDKLINTDDGETVAATRIK